MTSLARLRPMVLKNRCHSVNVINIICRMCTENGGENSPLKNRPMVTAEELQGGNSPNKTDIVDDYLQAPTTCCMSGCSNCVWIQYAERLSETMKNSNEDIQEIIMNKVEDPNMRAFLSLELRCRNLTKT